MGCIHLHQPSTVHECLVTSVGMMLHSVTHQIKPSISSTCMAAHFQSQLTFAT